MESAAANNDEVIEKVMGELETFWMSDAEDAGEAIFNGFAEKYADQFDGDYDAP